MKLMSRRNGLCVKEFPHGKGVTIITTKLYTTFGKNYIIHTFAFYCAF
jgi:hypothetical protein